MLKVAGSDMLLMESVYGRAESEHPQSVGDSPGGIAPTARGSQSLGLVAFATFCGSKLFVRLSPKDICV